MLARLAVARRSAGVIRGASVSGAVGFAMKDSMDCSEGL